MGKSESANQPADLIDPHGALAQDEATIAAPRPIAVDLPAGAKVLELECDPLDRSWDDDSCWCFPAFRE